MTDDLFPRLRAVCDLDVAGVREGAGRHEYDGVVQDLSPAGVRAGLAALARPRGAPGRGGAAPRLAAALDPVLAANKTAYADELRVRLHAVP